MKLASLALIKRGTDKIEYPIHEPEIDLSSTIADFNPIAENRRRLRKKIIKKS